jgi:hypothetical protein
MASSEEPDVRQSNRPINDASASIASASALNKRGKGKGSNKYGRSRSVRVSRFALQGQAQHRGIPVVTGWFLSRSWSETPFNSRIKEPDQWELAKPKQRTFRMQFQIHQKKSGINAENRDT